MMKFSVLISLYFKENPKYLEECLKSIYNQTLKADEIIMVFDGNISDKLKSIVISWANRLPLKIVKLPTNVGLGKALNEGLKYCSNEWIFRMDTDDICLPNRFMTQIEYIKLNPNVVLLGSQIREFDSNLDNEIGIKRVPLDKNEIRKFSIKRNPFNHMTVAYKKSIIEGLGGYRHHLYMEDYNLWLRIIGKGYNIANLPDILVNVRSGNDMYTRRKGWEYIKSEYILFKLKTSLKLQPNYIAFYYFILRTLPRLLPSHLLGKIYKILRKSK